MIEVTMSKKETKIEKIKRYVRENKTTVVFAAGMIVGISEMAVFLLKIDRERVKFMKRPDMGWIQGMLNTFRDDNEYIWWNTATELTTIGELGKAGEMITAAAEKQLNMTLSSDTIVNGITVSLKK